MATPEVIAEQEALKGINADYNERFGFRDAENYLYKAPKGINREIVEKISEFKSEPQWMREFRLKSLDHFFAHGMPRWGSPMLDEVDFDDVRLDATPLPEPALPRPAALALAAALVGRLAGRRAARAPASQ